MDSKQDNSASAQKPTILGPVFYPAAGLIALLVVLTAIFPGDASALFNSVNTWILQSVGWFYALSVTAFLVFSIILAGSRFGEIRLGPDHAGADYNFPSWFAMLFSAGMGIGLLFFAVGEPMTHFLEPPAGQGETAEAARMAMQLTYFHWGLHAWAIYAVVGLVLAYFGFRHRLPLTIRSALYPIIGDRIYGPIGHVIDIFAVIGTLFGVATSLGFGVSQINAGLGHLFGIEVSIDVQVILIALITAAATASVVSGLDRGIKRLSEINLTLALALFLFVVLLGPTLLILNSFVENLGGYVQTVFTRSLMLETYGDGASWLGGWTIFYWGWWISWSPFVGMFIARISRGRTIREFVLGALLVPSFLSFMWITAFGNTAIFFELRQGVGAISQAVNDNLPLALFAFLEQLPFADITSFVAIILVVVFFVTSSDSGSLVIDIITAGGNTETPVWQRVFWAVTEGVVAAVLMLAGGLAALQTAAVASALPFAIIIAVSLFGLYRGLKMEVMKTTSAHRAPHYVPASSPVPWRKRLYAILSHPGRKEVEAFIEETVNPALSDVAKEIEAFDCAATAVVNQRDAELRVYHDGAADFRFAVHPRGYLRPAFAFPEFDPKDDERKRFYRAEVHLQEGGQDYDIYGYNREQVIHEVLNQYYKHMQFLHLAQGTEQ